MIIYDRLSLHPPGQRGVGLNPSLSLSLIAPPLITLLSEGEETIREIMTLSHNILCRLYENDHIKLKVSKCFLCDLNVKTQTGAGSPAGFWRGEEMFSNYTSEQTQTFEDLI